MRFLNRVHFNSAMTPMELDVFHNIRNVIGVDPAFYEFILMVDADTGMSFKLIGVEVEPDSLNRLVSHMIKDSKILGICGETRLSNENKSWVTMIQVYEYFISHHLAKAFESLFGSVTCMCVKFMNRFAWVFYHVSDSESGQEPTAVGREWRYRGLQ
jgi:chitin synthase